MKKLLLLLLTTFLSLSYSQEIKYDSIKRKPFSFNISFGLEGFGMNSFLNKTYKNTVATKLGFSFHLNEKIGIGLLTSFKFPSIKSTEYVGEAKSTLITELGAFLSYRHNYKNKISLINKVGISNYILKNTLKNDYRNFDYKTEGYKLHWTPEIDYHLNNKWALFLETSLGYIHFDSVNATSLLNTEYRKHFNYAINFGTKLKF